MIAAADRADSGAAVRERPVILRAGGHDLFAIVTEPASPAAGAPRAGIVYLTRPRSHRNRMWVDAARAMAARGFVGLRFDYHGEGDSTGASRYLNPETPYGEEAAAAARYLAEEAGAQRVGILGSCFDGRTALNAVHAAPKFDGLVFMSAPVLDDQSEHERLVAERDTAHYLRRLRDPDAWRVLVSPERLGLALTILSTRIVRGAARLFSGARPGETPSVDRTAPGGPGANGGPKAPAAPSASFLRDFRALVARGTPALFLYGDEDDQYPGFRTVIDGAMARLTSEERARFSIVVLPGEAHGYLSIPMQQEIVRTATGWLERTLGG